MEKEKIETWLAHPFFEKLMLRDDLETFCNDEIIIIIMEIKTPFDWLKVRRLLKKHPNLLLFPLIDASMLQTAPIVIELQLPSLFIKPISKHLFYRNIKKVLDSSNRNMVTFEQENSADEQFLQSILREEVALEQMKTLLIKGMIPNVVYFIQGFVLSPKREENEGWQASSVIQRKFMKALSTIGNDVYFLPFRKHLVFTLKIPKGIAAPCYWEEGEKTIVELIDLLKHRYGIQLYIGVGSIHRELSGLKKSYQEARTARRSPPRHRLSLRYFDEIPPNLSVQTSIDYIAEHFAENLTIQQAANEVNFSPTYFSRIFKKETGHSFVSYLTFVRIQKAVWLLRHTDQTIEKIAFEQGFNTPSYFSTIFKKVVGLSPSEYRATREIIFI
ncbi:AraC family transcriptional regulator [Bacillus sp. SD075]|uniref:helix-turn-helix domain-containing protein n=1 Tax=Bacillus sp. SD075 TaxID=2781732 RepID=UPI001A95D29F|nr:helix-turn-helix domain-containing protein [Bacillus sp. SD075]MBO0999941.1 AraC family transcriptional regulator [Bacillus sp. SD075]